MSESHVTDEGTSLKLSEDKKSRLSLLTGTNEGRTDLTFQTEEWVRVSDFDVGTPTSTTVKSDSDAQDSFSDVPGLDKLVDWETISRENAGNSSSAEEIGEADHLAAEEAGFGQNQGQKLPHVDVVLSGSDSEKEDDDKSMSSRSIGGKSSRSLTSSSRSADSTSDAYPKISDEERSSSIVVVPLYQAHEDDSQKNGYVSVASVEAQEDDYHRRVTTVSSPEGKEVDYQASRAIGSASSEEQEEGSFEHLFGVEDHASSAIEPVSSGEQEEGKCRLFTNVSNMKDVFEDVERGSNAVDLTSLIRPQNGEESSPNESVLVGTTGHPLSQVEGGNDEPKVIEEYQTTGNLKTQADEVPELTQVKPETIGVNELNQEVTKFVTSEPYAQSLPVIHCPEQNNEGDRATEETIHVIGPMTPERTSEKNFIETLYTFVRAVGDEEILEAAKASLLEVRQSAPTLSLSEAKGVKENAAKEVYDTSFSGGLPEPNQEEPKQVLEIVHSEIIAVFGTQEAKFPAQKERELGTCIVGIQPLLEVSATMLSKPVEGGELKDFQYVLSDEAPLVKESSSLFDSDLDNIAELKYRVPELFTKLSGEELLEESQGGIQDEHQTAEALLVDDSVLIDLSVQTKLPLAEKEQRFDEKAGSDSFLVVDHVSSAENEGLPTEIVPLTTTSSEKSKCAADSTKVLEATFEAKNVDKTGKFAGSSKRLEQVTYQRKEVSVHVLLYDSYFCPLNPGSFLGF